MNPQWGRFTVRGSAEVEARITEMIDHVGRAVAGAVAENEIEALILLGGYGRGEGGVELVEGEERPHNNFDLLLLTSAGSKTPPGEMKRTVDQALAPLIAEYDLGMDAAVLAAARLKASPCLVMWYDMRFGHKTIIGNADFVPSLERFTLQSVPAWDVRNLMVNRGTLLVINDLILDQKAIRDSGAPELALADRRLIVKHAMKAIIGYGDSLLYFLGDYDWSYAEKQRRMKARGDVSGDIRQVYDAAVEFRFQPDYDPWLKRDPDEWMDELKAVFAPLHLVCETRRLGKGRLDWGSYPDAAFKAALGEAAVSLRSMAKAGVNVLKGPAHPGPGSGLARLGYRTLGWRGVLPILFPVPAYGLTEPDFVELTAAALGEESGGRADLRRAYLRTWAEHGDTNFKAVLDKYGLDVSPRPAGGGR